MDIGLMYIANTGARLSTWICIVYETTGYSKKDDDASYAQHFQAKLKLWLQWRSRAYSSLDTLPSFSLPLVEG